MNRDRRTAYAENKFESHTTNLFTHRFEDDELPICAYTPVCEEDVIWIDNYLSEIERLSVRFAIHLDRCSENTKKKLTTHALCVGYTEQKNPNVDFSEIDRAGVFRLCRESGALWAWNWDVDETLETTAPDKIKCLLNQDCDVIQFHRKELWESPHQVRVDGIFKQDSRRERLFNLKSHVLWCFKSGVVNGPSYCSHVKPIYYLSDVVCLHWGHLTHELRLRSKDRWDRIYTNQVGCNPYLGWEGLLEYTALEVKEHRFLDHIKEQK